MSDKIEGKRFIKFKTHVNWGIAPLPTTTFRLMAGIASETVRIFHTRGQTRNVVAIKVPSGSLEHWLGVMLRLRGQTDLSHTFFNIEDGNTCDLWVQNCENKFHLEWMGEAPSPLMPVNEFTNWLYDLLPAGWGDD